VAHPCGMALALAVGSLEGDLGTDHRSSQDNPLVAGVSDEACNALVGPLVLVVPVVHLVL